jgi:hypothetical protein
METFKVTSPAPRDVWHTLMKTDPEALPYQSHQWLDAICDSGRYKDASRLYEASDGQQILIPFVRSVGVPVGLSTLSSLPNSWGMGGFLSSRAVQKHHVEAVFSDFLKLPFLRLNLRPNPRQGEVWASAMRGGVVAVPRLAHVLDLRSGFDDIWKNKFVKATHKRVRKAEKAGVVIECDTTGRLLPVFYDLLLKSMDRWSAQQHEPRWLTHLRGQQRDPLEKFQTIAKYLGEACCVWVAWADGKPAAASLVLQYGNVNDSRGAMDKELSSLTGANDLLMKHTIEHACQSGCQFYHMGESGKSESLAHFKGRFGAEPVSYAEYRIERLPISRIDGFLRGLVKKMIGFKD